MKVFVMILMFVFVIYVTNMLDTGRERKTAHYFSVAVITLAYLACCMYALISMGW